MTREGERELVKVEHVNGGDGCSFVPTKTG